MRENRHSRKIPMEVLEQAQTHIDSANNLLRPYTLVLTPADRHEIPKMGQKSLAFVEKSYEFASKNANLVPSYLDMAEFDIDFADARGLWTLKLAAQQLLDRISDTQMDAGSEAYQTSLVFYSSAKVAAAKSVDGASAVYEELRKRFPGGSKRHSNAQSNAN